MGTINKHFNRLHLGSTGIAHYLIPLVIIALVSIVGTFMIVSSNANSTKPAQAKVTIKAVYAKACVQDKYKNTFCKLGTSKDVPLYATSPTPGAKCNGHNISFNADDRNNSGWTNLGKARKLTCSPGTYNFRLADDAAIPYKCRGDICTTLKVVKTNLSAKARATYTLGTKPFATL